MKCEHYDCKEEATWFVVYTGDCGGDEFHYECSEHVYLAAADRLARLDDDHAAYDI